MRTAKNILFIMCDQLRRDYLSCSGHPYLKTPNIDSLAAKGLRFSNAYVQSPVCGSSRMSFYTGRYVSSHGASWNGIPLKVGEMTMGDYMRPLGLQTALVGKTHMRADIEGMQRLGVDLNSEIGVRIAECGFDPYERDDGLHGYGPDGWYDAGSPTVRYNNYLREHGFEGDNPWHSWANAAEDVSGNLLSGWLMNNAAKPARIPEEHSETPYMTRRAMDFIREKGDDPWCLHLSYIKPHWPYIAPAPYHNMYSKENVVPAVRSAQELDDPHPIYYEFTQHRVGQCFADDDLREAVVPVYMGLIKQIDDQLGALWRFLEEQGRFDDTMIVFTSDHGDYLGDHWLGEKDLFHDASVKVPMIIYDPREEADHTRGKVCDVLVESIDLLPTFVEFAKGKVPCNRLEGRSLEPWLHNETVSDWREYAISEYDYAQLDAGAVLGVKPKDARLFMVLDQRYKYIYAPGFRPLLFDLKQDPNELNDIGTSVDHQGVCQRLHNALSDWGLRNSQRTTISDEQIEQKRGGSFGRGILIGVKNSKEISEDILKHLK